MNNSLLIYMESNFLKKGEEFDVSQLNDTTNSIIDIPIIKPSYTKIKQVGLVTCTIRDSNESEKERSPEDPQLLKFTQKKKVGPNELPESLALAWIDEGWLVKEIRFKKDGKTVETTAYRMGYRLYRYQQIIKEQHTKHVEHVLIEWKNKTAALLSEKTSRFLPSSQKSLQALVDYLSSLLSEEQDGLWASPYIPDKWPLNKKVKFLHLLTAILQLCFVKTEFDWKEIGAQYYQEIGGSKEFDAYKEEFIVQLEEIMQAPVATIGLISLGKITPLYFSGQLTGRFSEYKYGPVHALTDLAIAQETYQSRAQSLWLVENRAILTRLSAEENFLKENEILLVCMDGHLRSSHRQCLVQLTKNSRFKQVLLWTDYDQDGLQIAGELYRAISEYYCGKIKWILHDQSIVESWQQYEETMKHLLSSKKMEQELILGSVEDWKKWIHLQ